MIKLTYRGITYKTQPVVNQSQEIDSVFHQKAIADSDKSKSTMAEKLNLYTYRGVSYIKLPIDC